MYLFKYLVKYSNYYKMIKILIECVDIDLTINVGILALESRHPQDFFQAASFSISNINQQKNLTNIFFLIVRQW